MHALSQDSPLLKTTISSELAVKNAEKGEEKSLSEEQQMLLAFCS